jgi:hypothetical protein
MLGREVAFRNQLIGKPRVLRDVLANHGLRAADGDFDGLQHKSAIYQARDQPSPVLATQSGSHGGRDDEPAIGCQC